MVERIAQFACYCIAMLVASLLFGCAASQPTLLPPSGSAIGSDQFAPPNNSRIRLTAPANFFISPTGSDDASGLTANTPWRTLQHAYDVVSQNYDLAGFPASIHLADGTYGKVAGKDNVVVCDGRIPGQVGPIRFIGNSAHPENVVISATSNNIFEIIATWAYVEGMTLTGTGSTVGLLSYFDARITFANIIFGPMGTGIHLSAFGGIIMPFSDYRITGGAGYHMLSESPGSRIHIDNKTITLSGTPHFSAAFAVAEDLAMISAHGNTFAGAAATGTRYLARQNAIIETSGDPNYFPGNAAGSTASGAQYGP